MSIHLSQRRAIVAETRARAGDPSGYALVRLAAWLFAVLEWMYDEHRDARMRARPAPSSIDEALTRLRGVSEDAPLYTELLAGLLSIDAEITREPWRWRGAPDHTNLPALPGLPELGVVRHRVRPASAWGALQLLRNEVEHQPMSYGPRPAHLLTTLAMERHHDRHAPVVVRASDRPNERLQRAWSRSRLRVALCPLLGAGGPHFAGSPGGFVARHDHAPVSLATLEAAVRAAAEVEAAILLLPELHLRAEEVAAVEALLEDPQMPSLVAAGSFHVVRDAETHNEAPVLGWPGQVVWRHQKRGQFRLTPDQWRRFPPETIDPPPDGVEAVEDIHFGRTLRFLDTPVGRIVLLICADCLDPDAWRAELITIRPDLVLVVSLGGETEPFERRAEEWTALGISTLWVNAACVPAPRLAFATLALTAGQAHPPPRARWGSGVWPRGAPQPDPVVEVWHPRRSPQWGPPLEGDGVVLIPGLGLVVDLGVQHER